MDGRASGKPAGEGDGKRAAEADSPQSSRRGSRGRKTPVSGGDGTDSGISKALALVREFES